MRRKSGRSSSRERRGSSIAARTLQQGQLPSDWRASYNLTLMVDTTQLQATLDKIPAYTWYANPTGGLTFVNTRCADYLGLPSDHPLRLGAETHAAWDSRLTFVHPDDIEETRRVWSDCLKTGSAGEVSFRARNADGAYRWFLSRAEPLRANDGAILYWIGINLDIEDRKRAEIELRQMLDLAPQLIAVLGPKRERLYGYRRSQAHRGPDAQRDDRAARRPGPRLDVRGDRRLIVRAAKRPGAGGEGCADGLDGAHLGRDRDRQRAGRPRRS